jgi:GntR family transcriptional regulator/MocR family aminotransferase
MIYPPWAGLPELRIAIAAYLQLSRGIDCTPSQVFITSGYRNSMELIARALLQPGDAVWVEDPAIRPPANCCASRPAAGSGGGGWRRPDGVARRRHRAQCQSRHRHAAHQSPLCVSLSLPRRLALLDWAAQSGAWIVEDDYDGEYRYVSRPLPALQSLDRDGRVLYSGTFSKVLFPAIRLAYLVVPRRRCRASKKSPAPSRPAADADAENRRRLHERRPFRPPHPAHAPPVCGAPPDRRRRPVAVLGKHVQVDPQPGGMHLVLRMKGRHTDRALAARMREHGMSALALSERGVLPHGASALLLAFTNIDTPARARDWASAY